MKRIFFLCLIAHHCFAGKPSELKPPEGKAVISKFFECIKSGDAASASLIVFKCSGREEQTESRVRTIAEAGKKLGTAPKLIDVQEKTSLGMAIVQDTANRPDGKPDYDGVLLIKRDGAWLVVLSIAELEDLPGALSTAELKELESIRKWQAAKMRELLDIKADSEQTRD
jgi:hypothetical protein